MMSKESGQQYTPLEIINRDAEQTRHIGGHAKRSLMIWAGTGIAVGLAELIGVSKQPQVDLGIFAMGQAVYTQDFLRSMLNRKWWQGLSKKEIGQAIDQIKSEGIDLESIPRSFESRGGFPESYAEYLLAQQVRATKLHLARQGGLKEYEKFKWLSTLPTPQELKPTQEDLDEAKEWAANEKAKLSNFVQELAKRQTIYIECGLDFDVRSTKVYLFKDEHNVFDYEALPLIDVMQGFAATHQELHSTVQNERRFDPAFLFSKDYDGINSKKGRQRIADFFNKPVAFYTGAEFGTTTVRIYGEPEPKLAVHGGLIEYFAGYMREPYHCLETVEPTEAKAEKIGLELARA